jgi:mannose-6-phosphate isomerase-like protein (cupin superfamily)
MDPYRIAFSCIAWESPMEGVRQKAFTDGHRRLRLVEYSRAMPAHWCERGHYGYVLEGVLQVEFESVTHVLSEGDGVFIPDGAAHRHRAQVLSDVVRVVFVEDA